MAEKKRSYDWWNHGINPITGWTRQTVRIVPYELKPLSMPTRGKTKYSN